MSPSPKLSSVPGTGVLRVLRMERGVVPRLVRFPSVLCQTTVPWSFGPVTYRLHPRAPTPQSVQPAGVIWNRLLTRFCPARTRLSTSQPTCKPSRISASISWSTRRRSCTPGPSPAKGISAGCSKSMPMLGLKRISQARVNGGMYGLLRSEV